MGTTQKNVNQQKQQHMVSRFMQGLRNALVAKAEERIVKEPGVRGFFRSSQYRSPAEHFSHKSGAFSRNQRAERKLGMKRRRAA